MVVNVMHIVVVGSGLAGATFVAAMADQPVRITILERQLPDMLVGEQDERPISLSYSTVTALKNLRLWPALQEYACPIKTVQVSEQGRLGSLELNAADAGLSALGYVVPFFRLYKQLYAQLSENAQVKVKTIHDINAINETPEHVSLTIKDHKGLHQLEADLLVAADGSNSRCRGLLNIKAKKTTHHDSAFTAILNLDGHHQYKAFERFTSRGTLALLPMWDVQQYRLVWTVDNDYFKTLSDEGIIKIIENSFRGKIGNIKNFKRLGQYPLQTILAERQTTQRAVLLGDSAHRIYPLAAQGYNLTMRDIGLLVECHADLVSYANIRKKDQRFTARFTQNLELLFGLNLPLLDHVRATGLFMLDLLPPMKRHLIRKFLGQTGRQPQLLCQE